MTEPKTSMGIPPITIKGHTFRVGRIVRFIVGIGLVIHAFAWTIRYLPMTVWGPEVAVGLLLIDPTLLTDAMSAWKSRNG